MLISGIDLMSIHLGGRCVEGKEGELSGCEGVV